MTIYATDADPKDCPICNTELHSNNSKRIGNRLVCKDCQFKLVEAWNSYGDALVRAARSARITETTQTLVWDDTVSP